MRRRRRGTASMFEIEPGGLRAMRYLTADLLLDGRELGGFLHQACARARRDASSGCGSGC